MAVGTATGWQLKLKEPPTFDGSMDMEVVEAWCWSIDNYCALVGLQNDVQKALFATTLMQKSASIWLRNQAYDMTTLTWQTLKHDLQDYFKPADYKRRIRDKLANCR